MRIEKRIVEGSYPDYMLRLIRSGRCPYLMKGAGYCEDGAYVLQYETSGFLSLCGFISEASVFSFSRLLSLLRKTAEGLRGLGDYLVSPAYVSLDPKEMYIFPEGNVNFLAGNGDGDAVKAFLGLCGELHSSFPLANTDLIIKKLTASNAEKLLDISDIIRMLSLWELEINN